MEIKRSLLSKNPNIDLSISITKSTFHISLIPTKLVYWTTPDQIAVKQSEINWQSIKILKNYECIHKVILWRNVNYRNLDGPITIALTTFYSDCTD